MQKVFSFHITFLIFLLLGSGAHSQNKMQRDTTILNQYAGVFSFDVKTSASSVLKNGSAKFESSLYQDSLLSNLLKLNIQGSYKDNRFHGYWTFSELLYTLNIKDISQLKTHQLEYELNGFESRVVMRFINGKATGRWLIDNYVIENGKQKDLQNSGFIFCEDGVFTGAFSYTNEEEQFSVQGNLNGLGYLNGALRLSWIDSLKGRIVEERLYQDGFLLQLSRYENNDSQPYLFIEYNDVKDQLIRIQNDPSSKIRISDGHYGIDFDNGYHAQDLRLKMQIAGNEIVEHFLESFERYLHGESNEFDPPVAKLTRRFVFAYNDPNLMHELESKLETVLEKTNEFINSPSNILYAAQSDTVAKALSIMTHLHEKALIIEDVLQKNKSGFFEIRNRNNFYANGVSGLNKNETIYYRNKKNEMVPFEYQPTILINSPSDLLEKLDAYLDFLLFKFNKHQLIAFNQVSDLEEREELRRIDSLIIFYEQKNDTYFGSIDELSKKPFESLRFEQKIYLLTHQKKLSLLRKNYIVKTDFIEKIDIGTQYVVALQNLNENELRLARIGQRQMRIDSLFTIYEDNPFDYREIELPILSQIKGKGLLLFRHYAELLYSETRPERFVERLELIEQLLNKLEYYAANYQNQEVIGLNRAVRRESVPARIERLFEIGIEYEIEP